MLKLVRFIARQSFDKVAKEYQIDVNPRYVSTVEDTEHEDWVLLMMHNTFSAYIKGSLDSVKKDLGAE